MADSKSVDLFLRVTTTLIGGDVLGKLSQGFGGLHKQVGLVHGAMGKIVGAAAAITIGYKGISAASDWLKKGVEGAKQTRDAVQSLEIALRRHPRVMKEGEQGVARYNREIIGAAEGLNQMTKQFTTGQLVKGFQELIQKGMDPNMVHKFSNAFQGLALRMGETPEATAKMISSFIAGGRVSSGLRLALQEVGITLEKGKTPLDTANKLYGKMSTNADLTGTAVKRLGTDLGQEQKRTVEALETAEKFGDPILKFQEAWGKAMGEMNRAMQPLVEVLTKELKGAVEAITKWLADPTTIKGMHDFGNASKDFFGWIKDNWQHVSQGLGAIGGAMATLTIVSVLTNPMLAAVATVMAMGAAVAYLSSEWEVIGPVVDEALGPLKNLWSIIEPGIREAGTNLVKYFKGEIQWNEAWQGMIQGFQKIDWALMYAEIYQVGLKIEKQFKEAISGIKNIDWDAVFRGIGALMMSAIINSIKVVAKAGELGAAFANAIMDVNWIQVFHQMDLAFTNAMQNILIGAWNQFLQSIPAGFKAAFGAVGLKEMAPITTPTAAPAAPAAPAWEPTPEFNEALERIAQAGTIAGMHAVSEMVVPPETPPAVAEVAKQAEAASIPALTIQDAAGNWTVNPAFLDQLRAAGTEMTNVANRANAVSAAMSGLSAPSVPAPAMQHGGIAEVPSLVGEAGPEIVLPLREPGRWGEIFNKAFDVRTLGKSAFDRFFSPQALGGAMGMSSAGPGTAMDFGKALEKLWSDIGIGPKVGGAGGATTINVSPNITINGVEGATAAVESVKKGMSDSVNDMLDQLRRAKEEERRLAYV